MSAATFYFLFASGIVLAFSRWWLPISWRAKLALVLLPLALFGKPLLTGQIIAPLDLHFRNAPLSNHPDAREIVDRGWSRTRYDMAFLMVPWRKAVRDAWLHGEWPLLDPSVAAGDALASSAQPAPYHPLQLISLALDFGPDLSFMNLSVLLLLLTGSFVWLRECRIGEAGAVTGAVGFAFCGFVMQWFGWPIILTLSALPMVLAATLRLLRSNDGQGFLLLTLSCSAMMLGGHPQTCVHIVGVGLALGALVTIRYWQEHDTLPWTGIGTGLLAGVLALGITAIFWLPMVEALRETAEFALRSSQTAVAVSWSEAIDRLGVVLVPFAHGLPHHDHWTTGGRWGAHWQAYVGGTLWGAALIPLIDAKLRKRPEVWLLVAASVCGALLLVAAPGLTDLFATLPLFELAINRRLTFLTGLALCTLAALGIDRWLAETGHTPSIAYALALLVIAGAIAWQWPSLVDAGLPSEYLARWTIVELTPMALALLLIVVGTRATRARPLLVLFLLGLTVGQRAIQTEGQNRAFDRRWLAPGEGALATLIELAAGEVPQRVIATGARLNPHLSTLYGLEDARGSNAITNRRFYETFSIWAAPKRRHRQIPTVRDLDAPFLSFLNVAYALTEPGFRARGWQPILTTARFSVLKNQTVLPRAFIPSRVAVGHTANQRLAAMQQTTDFLDLAWIESNTAPKTGPIRNGSGRVDVRRNGPDLKISAILEHDAWVVISQTAWPGWRAFEDLNGKSIERPLSIANHAFLALHLDAGAHELKLMYRPRTFTLGLWVSALTSLLLAGLIIRHALRARPLGRQSFTTKENLS